MRSKYGRHIADQLDGNAYVNFAIVEVLDLVVAVPAAQLEQFTAACKADSPHMVVQDSGKRALGYRLATQADRLDAGSVDAAVKAVAAEKGRFEAERDERARAHAAQAAAGREQAEETRTYGIPVPSDDDG